MKNKLFLIGGLMFLIALAMSLALMSFKGSDEPKAFEFEFAPPDNAYKAYPADTLSNALKDTLVLPYTFASRYTYSVHFTLAAISGTRAMKIYLDESNTLSTLSSSTGWVAVDSLTPTAAVNEYVMRGPQVYGRKLRLRVSGNTGATQAVRYTATALFKPEPY